MTVRSPAAVPVLAALAALASSQASAPPLPKQPTFDPTWTREAWTADEAPYLAVRREVETYTAGRRVSDRKTDLVGRTERMLAAWTANPRNPVVLYRAAYYAYVLAGLDFSPEAKALLKANWIDMGSVPSPRSREYDRLRMLRDGFLNQVFIDLGERLYRRDPGDVELALKLAWTHSRYGPASPKRAVNISERLLRESDPQRFPAIYYVCGDAHGVSFTTEPERERVQHAKRAAWAFGRYIKTGPSWRPKVIDAKSALAWFEKYLKELGQPVPSG